jgi:hypothetical protein
MGIASLTLRWFISLYEGHLSDSFDSFVCHSKSSFSTIQGPDLILMNTTILGTLGPDLSNSNVGMITVIVIDLLTVLWIVAQI